MFSRIYSKLVFPNKRPRNDAVVSRARVCVYVRVCIMNFVFCDPPHSAYIRLASVLARPRGGQGSCTRWIRSIRLLFVFSYFEVSLSANGGASDRESNIAFCAKHRISVSFAVF